MLRLGYRANETRDAIWIDDPALRDVPASAREDWEKDGLSHHLENFAAPGEQPTVFRMRALSFDESQYVSGMQDGTTGGMMLTFATCFRMGVSFPTASESYRSAETGVDGKKIERKSGFRMLSEGFCDELRHAYPGIIQFYGYLIWKATFPTEPEKKASSPPSTLTPSSAAESTKDVTADPVQAAAPVA